jgi:hypothetical protein
MNSAGEEQPCHGLQLTPRLETVINQHYTADRSNSRTTAERWEFGVDAALRFGPGPLDLRGAYRYIDFTSTIVASQSFHGHELPCPHPSRSNSLGVLFCSNPRPI